MSVREHGKGSLGCIVGLLLVVGLVLAGVKVIPVKVAVSELYDFAEKQAQQASLPTFTDEAITNAIVYKASQLHLPLKREEVKVWRDGSQAYVEYAFRVVLEFPGYTYNWDVKEHIERVLF